MSDKETEVKETETVEAPAEEKVDTNAEDVAHSVFTKRFNRDVKKKFDALEARLAELDNRPAKTADDVEADPKEDKVANLEKKLKAMEGEIKRKEADLVAKEERTTVFGAISEAGAINADVLYDHLKARGYIGRNDEGEVVFKVQREDYVDEVPFAKGLKEFLKASEVGKMFVPASGAKGSGTKAAKPATSTAQREGKLTKEEARSMLFGIAENLVSGRNK